ncbi:hypothetical protein A1A1_15693 [Planococcus antarcticus DSM 14505]|uniref:DUF2834 domain-containing protein n=1 Tax=Planococcus antarcticus DSM 14505 TaxID=1185653 RepID=A0AA87IIU4_9BACL|nr:hypothetical protein [Planococcus antarcticus]EIM05530.1 hypothetical protein A1A1_15693 [Planococcus antarcticus DSM 14505]
MIFLIVWLLLIGYAVFLAPGGETDPIVSSIFSGDLGAIDPLVLAVFNSLGLFPLIFVTVLLLNDRQKWPAWPFALLSFGVGAFSLLPYFAFGSRQADRGIRTPAWLVRFLSSRFWLIVLMLFWVINALTLLQGFSLAAYQDAFFASGLVSVMTVDWFVLWGLSVYTVYRFYPDAKLKSLAWIPILGPVLVLFMNKNSKH